jgi:hypothetical protein
VRLGFQSIELVVERGDAMQQHFESDASSSTIQPVGAAPPACELVPGVAAVPKRVRGIIEASIGQVFGILAGDFGRMTRGPARVALAR